MEYIIAIAIGRIEVYQTASDGKFACDENAAAIELLKQAGDVLDSCTKRREANKTEGTHEGN